MDLQFAYLIHASVPVIIKVAEQTRTVKEKEGNGFEASVWCVLLGRTDQSDWKSTWSYRQPQDSREKRWWKWEKKAQITRQISFFLITSQASVLENILDLNPTHRKSAVIHCLLSENVREETDRVGGWTSKSCQNQPNPHGSDECEAHWSYKWENKCSSKHIDHLFWHVHRARCGEHTHACTHAQEGGEPQSVVAHGEVVWFRPDHLHNVLIELGLFPLCQEKADSHVSFKMFGPFYPMIAVSWKADKSAHQGRTELFKIKHFILVLFSQFFPQNDGLLPHLLDAWRQRQQPNQWLPLSDR